jgi:spore germination cell wall hydrolase CwlJ-like protein
MVVYAGQETLFIISDSESTVKTAPRSAPIAKSKSQEEFENRKRRCLPTAIYWEVRDWSIRGQIAEGQVIMNRVRSPQFPNTICGVVYQGKPENICAFSFACDDRNDIPPKEDEHWWLAQKLARQLTIGQVWLPELGYSTSRSDALAIEASVEQHWAVQERVVVQPA